MGRPAKAVGVLVGHKTSDEKAARSSVEGQLRGGNDLLKPPAWLNKGQKKIFKFVIEELKASDILGNLDIYVLTQFAVAAERLIEMERYITQVGIVGASADKTLIAARNAYMSDFWRGVNELSLSPQARAKIGTLNLNKKDESEDPLKKLLAGKGN